MPILAWLPSKHASPVRLPPGLSEAASAPAAPVGGGLFGGMSAQHAAGAGLFSAAGLGGGGLVQGGTPQATEG